jgi:ABC-type transporter Mla subunit MlaD
VLVLRLIHQVVPQANLQVIHQAVAQRNQVIHQVAAQRNQVIHQVAAQRNQVIHQVAAQRNQAIHQVVAQRNQAIHQAVAQRNQVIHQVVLQANLQIDRLEAKMIRIVKFVSSVILTQTPRDIPWGLYFFEKDVLLFWSHFLIGC